MKWSLLALVIITGVLAGAGKHQQAHGEDRVVETPREPRGFDNVLEATQRSAGVLVGMCVNGFAFWMDGSGYMAPQPDPDYRSATRKCTGRGYIQGSWIDMRSPETARFVE